MQKNEQIDKGESEREERATATGIVRILIHQDRRRTHHDGHTPLVIAVLTGAEVLSRIQLGP